ncbi:MAG: 5'-deoxynucleotidase [Eubacteriales bacterium]
MANSFFALLFRQKYIKRWSLMRNSEEETLSRHSMECAVLTHALAVVGNRIYGRSYDAAALALRALYHDAAEVFTGDLPTPTKYFSPQMRRSYADIEKSAVCSLLSQLPEELRGDFEPLLADADGDGAKIIKAADKLCALIKCADELKSGNAEFRRAYDTTEASLLAMDMDEVRYFMRELMPSFSLSLDDMNE